MTPVTDETNDMIHAQPQWKGKLYGVELEIEADGLYGMEEVFNEDNEHYDNIEPDVPAGWLREQEDSIAGVELISDKPYSFEETVTNIERVFKDIERQGFRPLRTPRGSTHVHANVADLTWQQLKHFITACAWAEPTLIELAGKGRKGNLFAQSYEICPIGWAQAIEWVRRNEIFQNIDTHYMATSFHPIGYLGSVEFRMGPSSRNAEDAIRWLQCIDTVVAAGREEKITSKKEPAFLDFLTSKFDANTQRRLRLKGSIAADEVWWAMSEPYIKPDKQKRGTKKSLAELVDQFPLSQTAEYSTQVVYTPPAPVAPLWSFEDYQAIAPAPPTPVLSTPASYIVPTEDCGDPNCPVCMTGVHAPGNQAPNQMNPSSLTNPEF